MRLVGGKDYYDSAMAYGTDESVVFVRHKNKYILQKNFKPHDWSYLGRIKGWNDYLHITIVDGKNNIMSNNRYSFIKNHKEYTFSEISVYLAGKRYNGLKLIQNDLSSKPSYFWNFDTLNNFLSSINLYLKNDHEGISKWLRTNKTSFESVKEYFSASYGKEIFDYLIDNRITIAIDNNEQICDENSDYKFINIVSIDSDGLKKVEFNRRMDAYSVFQEISMWIGGVMPKQETNPTGKKKFSKPVKTGGLPVEITDNKVKIHKAGFDVKTSFRRSKKHT